MERASTSSPAPSSAPSQDEIVDVHDLAVPTTAQTTDGMNSTTHRLIATSKRTAGIVSDTDVAPVLATPILAPNTVPTQLSSDRPSTALELNLASMNSEGDTPLATASTSATSARTMTPTAPTANTPHASHTPHSPHSPHTPQAEKPRLGGQSVRPGAGSPSTQPSSRSVSATMAHAYAMATEQPPSDSGRQDAEGATPGGMPGDFTASGLGGEDDEWVSFVRAQLVRLFPDFHDAEGAPAEQEEAEAESDEPTFRSELLAMRTEIGVLRGIVAELSDTRETQEPETQEPEIQEPEVQEPAPAPVPVELNPTALGLALAVVRALDASRSGARPDSEVFEHANLHALLAAVPRPSLSTEAAPDSIPGSPPAPAPASPPLPAPHDVHAKLDAHEEIEKAHDVSIAPEVGTRPKARAHTCEADEMCDEELQEVAEMAGEAQPLVS